MDLESKRESKAPISGRWKGHDFMGASVLGEKQGKAFMLRAHAVVMQGKWSRGKRLFTHVQWTRGPWSARLTPRGKREHLVSDHPEKKRLSHCHG